MEYEIVPNVLTEAADPRLPLASRIGLSMLLSKII
jgi:hypothetical protein